jgi:hypothetical protein
VHFTTPRLLIYPAKAWKNWYKLYYPGNVNKINELKKGFAKSTLYKDNTNPDEWFAEMYAICQQ